MAIPALVLPKETYDSIDEAHWQLLTLVYPMSHHNIHVQNRRDLSCTFRCASKSAAGTCPFSIAAKRVNTDSRWTLKIIKAKHDHEKGQLQKPRKGSVLHEVLQELANARRDDAAAESDDSASQTPQARTPRDRLRRRHPSHFSEELDDVSQERRAPRSPGPEVEEELEEDSEEKMKPPVDDESKVLVLSDSDDDDMGDSLITFLDSLSSTFKLSKYVDVFRNPEIGVETKEQLIEVCEWDMDGLMDVVGKKMGFAPANAFKKGMEKVMLSRRNSLNLDGTIRLKLRTLYSNAVE